MFRALLALSFVLTLQACSDAGPVTAQGDPCQDGEDALAEGNSEAAITSFEACLESVELEPAREAIIHTRLGGAYLYEERFEDALHEFNLAYAIAETQGVEFDNPYVRRNRGIARRYTGNTDGAIEDLEAARRELPQDVMTQLNLGGLYGELGRNAEAVAAFDTVTRLEPEWAGGWINLSAALLDLDLNDQAIDNARRAVEIDPESGFALNALCWALVMNSQYDTALPICDQAVDAEPENGAIVHSRAAALEGLDRIDEARELYARAYELNPDSETLERDYLRTRINAE
ncbi:tetratricopeptide repeat protein [Hyphobacterium sp.]|uniref:tetratricopeptide repeat protein n=1 Tax=Hyphobacterium sp. TaxID=2004662 RepID=UPI003BA88237